MGVHDKTKFFSFSYEGFTQINKFYFKKGFGAKMDYKRTKNYKNIKSALLEELEKRENRTAYFENLVEDYMNFYSTKEDAKREIQDKGLMVQYQNGASQKGYKKNDMIDVIIKVNQQMIKILDKLDIHANTDLGVEDDEL